MLVGGKTIRVDSAVRLGILKCVMATPLALSLLSLAIHRG